MNIDLGMYRQVCSNGLISFSGGNRDELGLFGLFGLLCFLGITHRLLVTEEKSVNIPSGHCTNVLHLFW